MAADFGTRFDSDERERIDALDREYWESGLDISRAFKNPQVMDVLNADPLILESFDQTKLLVGTVFNPGVLLKLCPICDCSFEPDLLKPYLDTGYVVPILTAQLAVYPAEFAAEIIKYPFMSSYEFSFVRKTVLLNESEGLVCLHCVGKHYERVQAAAKRRRKWKAFEDYINCTYRNLDPFIHPDYALLEDLEKAIQKGDRHRMEQLEVLSAALARVRTAQAFHSTLAVDFKWLQQTSDFVTHVGDVAISAEVQSMRELLWEGLGLRLTDGLAPAKYLELIDPYRRRIQASLKSLNLEDVSTPELVEQIATINEEIRRAERSTRHKVLQAVVSFASSNIALTASILGGATLGLAGSLVGCGAALSAGLTLKVLSAKGKINLPAEIEEARRAVHRTIDPAVDRVLAHYLGISLPAIQIWHLREELSRHRNRS